MSNESWDIDPTTGDYIMVNGAPSPTKSLRVPAFYRIKIPRREWMYAPDKNYGSNIATIKKRTNDFSQILNAHENALKPMVDDGRASEATAQVDATQVMSRNSAAIAVSIIDSQGDLEELKLPSIGV